MLSGKVRVALICHNDESVKDTYRRFARCVQYNVVRQLSGRIKTIIIIAMMFSV